jgi:molecular chaperone GrpE
MSKKNNNKTKKPEMDVKTDKKEEAVDKNTGTEVNAGEAEAAEAENTEAQDGAKTGDAQETPAGKADDGKADDGKKELEEKLEALKKENETLKASVAKEKNDYLRLAADLDNVRRRFAQEKLDLVTSASADTIKGILPVLDDCESALKMLEKSTDEAAKEGTQLIYTKLMGYLKTKGLEPIKAKDEKFDTDFHEAVAQFPVQEEEKKGLVFDVLQTGYTLGGKVIRFAKVVVGI